MKARWIVSKWMPVLAWMLLIFAGSSDALSAEHTSRFLVPFLLWLDPHLSMATLITIHFVVRKLGHFCEYAILAALLWRGLRGTFQSVTHGKLAALTFLVTAMFASSDEFHQSFVPTRTASAHDVMIDCFGALFAVLLCFVLAQSRTRRATAPI